MLSIWWRINGIIHWEILSGGCNMTAELYCQQLDRFAEKLREEQDRIYYLHDNARSHVTESTHEKLLKLGWIIVPYPPYSFNLTPTDYYLFRSLSNHLREKKFDDENEMKIDLINFFGLKSKDFYEGRILLLAECYRLITIR